MKIIIASLFFIILLISCGKAQEEIKLKKIIFNTDDNGCWGLCPIYHLEINDDLNVKLHMEKFLYEDSTCYKTKFEYCEPKTDSSKVGYFKGKISLNEFNKISEFVTLNRFDTIQNNSAKMNCNDALYKKYILYFNQNQRKEIHYRCAENSQLDSLSDYLFDLIDKNDLERTQESFFIENVSTKN